MNISGIYNFLQVDISVGFARNSQEEETMSITGILVASHCKLWRDCKNEERLNGENGLLLTPSIDHLFRPRIHWHREQRESDSVAGCSPAVAGKNGRQDDRDCQRRVTHHGPKALSRISPRFGPPQSPLGGNRRIRRGLLPRPVGLSTVAIATNSSLYEKGFGRNANPLWRL